MTRLNRIGNVQQGALRWLEIAGLALVACAVLWWALVYAQVMGNTGFPLQRTLPCLFHTSDRCSLAMSLCKDWHFLGIKRYSAELLWIGAATAALALLLGGYSARFDKDRKDWKP